MNAFIDTSNRVARTGSVMRIAVAITGSLKARHTGFPSSSTETGEPLLRVIHIVTNAIFPTPGGLEASVLRIARVLAEPSASTVVVYTRKQAAEYTRHESTHAGLEVVHLGQEKPFLMEPFSGNSTESFRLDYLLLVAEVQKRMQAAPGTRHVVISFFATNIGFLAQQVALTLGIPHVASIRGTDFSRDFRTPHLSHAIQFVVERAQIVVTTNQEQARVLAAAFPAARAFRTIHNAMPKEIVQEPWTPPGSTPIRLATDCQFSFKKATHLLLRAVAELLGEGADITLTVAGETAAAEASYWEQCKQDYSARFPKAFCFPGWISEDDVNTLLLSSHVYVSASLGEGCSLSQIRALTLGIPMVVTRCGALPELVTGAGHVRLCPAGSVRALAAELRSMVADLRCGTVTVDRERIREWRRHFSPAREQDEWEEVLANV